MPTASAALFGVEFDLLDEALGPQAAVEILRALGDYTNRHFKPVGAFSARHHRDHILTIFPHTGLDKARELVAGFAEELKHEALALIQSIVATKANAEACVEIQLCAGYPFSCSTSSMDGTETCLESTSARGSRNSPLPTTSIG